MSEIILLPNKIYAFTPQKVYNHVCQRVTLWLKKLIPFIINKIRSKRFDPIIP